MVDLPGSFTINDIWGWATTFMGGLSGAFKKIAPPNSKIWIIVGTLSAAAAYAIGKLVVAQKLLLLPRSIWMVCAAVCLVLGFLAVYSYVRNREERTIGYEGDIKLAGTEAEYRDDVKADPQNAGKSRDELLRDAAGDPADVWTPHALRKSRRILGRGYSVMVFLFALGLCLGVEAFNMQETDPAFADKVSKLRDVHFELNKSALSTDAIEILKADAEILEDAFQKFPKATVILEGYCDDRGDDQYNFNLGYNRADAVRNALIADGIESQKLSVVSHGRKDSNCKPDDDACRSAYRRVRLTAVQN
jgi:outer membrane protein OmpA-like peptidoglycan-associated protein